MFDVSLILKDIDMMPLGNTLRCLNRYEVSSCIKHGRWSRGTEGVIAPPLFLADVLKYIILQIQKLNIIFQTLTL